jgi:hypothetical protein
MSLIKVWDIHTHVLYSYNIRMYQRSSELSEYHSTLVDMCVCVSECTAGAAGVYHILTEHVGCLPNVG